VNEEILQLDDNIVNRVSPYPLSSVDCTFSEFNLKVMSILDKFAPAKKKIIKGRFSPWLSTTVLKSMKSRNCAYKKDLKSNFVEDWKLYRRIRNETSRMIGESKKSYFRNKFSESRDTTNLWNTVDELTKFRTKVNAPISSLQINGDTITEEEDIIEALANEFMVQAEDSVTSNDMNNAVNDYVTNYVFTDASDNIRDKIDVVPKMVSSEIEKCIKSMKNKKGGCSLFPNMFYVKKLCRILLYTSL
jgi:hypothetical protein